MKRTTKIGISNNTERIRVVWVEPIPEDYTLLSGESLEIVVSDPAGTPWFHVVEWPYATQIYVDGVSSVTSLYEIVVLQNGNKLEPGHQRDKGIEAGLRY
jgi:hypothetical protein